MEQLHPIHSHQTLDVLLPEFMVNPYLRALNALTSGMTKLQINTSYTPYNAGFTPYDTNTPNANTPNVGNSNGATPTGFRFNALPNLSNPSSNPLNAVTPTNIKKENNDNNIQQQQQTKLNSNAQKNINNNLYIMKAQQLQHQQKAERVTYSYPSYAEAVMNR